MMGLPTYDPNYNSGGVGQSDKPQKATFSGITALVGILALITDVISVAVPHWGRYQPASPAYYGAGLLIHLTHPFSRY